MQMLGHKDSKDVMRSSDVCMHIRKPHNMAATNAFGQRNMNIVAFMVWFS